MKKNIILIILAVLSIGGYLFYTYLTTDTMKVTNTIEEPCFTIELPKAFYKDVDANESYLNDEKMMFIEFDYYSNELGLDGESMLYNLVYGEFFEDDIISIDQVNINDEEFWQAEYRTLTTGLDGIHYYYSGLMTVFELEEEIFVVDTYQAMDEAQGINSKISDADLMLLKDITATVKITDEKYENIETYEQKIEGDKVTLVLSNNWKETTVDENGFYDFGYYASYSLIDTPSMMEIYEYNEENKFSLEDIQHAPSDYEFLNITTVGGEEAYIYYYNAYTVDGNQPYYYGVVAISEHYWIDFYFKSYVGDYSMTEATIEVMADFLESID